MESYRSNWDWINNDWRTAAATVLVTVCPPLLMWCFGLLVFRSWHFDVPWRLRARAEPPYRAAPSGVDMRPALVVTLFALLGLSAGVIFGACLG